MPVAASPVAICETLVASPAPNFHLTSYLSEAAERWPLRTLTVDGTEFTYEKAWFRILQVATWLQQNGVQRGDRVVAVLRQSPDLHLITLAVAHVGGVVSILSPQIRAEGFREILTECQPVCVFLEKTSRHLRSTLESGLIVWMDAGLNTGGWEEAEFDEVVKTAPAWGMRFPGNSDDPAFLVYPRNSTGATRGVLLSHNRVRSYLSDGRNTVNGLLSIFDSTVGEQHHAADTFAALSDAL
ncbi:MAG TPA: class I adenylate-forming enzyme family protein [Prosthecobacter sp.]|nr:class I adenylate-forming enzyme family protein [Prosthecobacter sp.]